MKIKGNMMTLKDLKDRGEIFISTFKTRKLDYSRYKVLVIPKKRTRFNQEFLIEMNPYIRNQKKLYVTVRVNNKHEYLEQAFSDLKNKSFLTKNEMIKNYCMFLISNKQNSENEFDDGDRKQFELYFSKYPEYFM